MMSKKETLVLGAALIGGAGIGLMILGKGKEGEEEGDEEPESKKQELMMHYEAPVYAPSEVYAPYTETNITDIIHNIITHILPPPVPDPIPDTTPYYRTESWREEQRAAGVHGYLTPEQQAAFDRGEPVSVSMIKKESNKGGYMGSGMTQSEYKSQFAHRTYGTSPTGQVVKPKKDNTYPSYAEGGYAHGGTGEPLAGE